MKFANGDFSMGWIPKLLNSGSLRRAYHTADHLPVAVEHAFVLMPSNVTGPTSEVGTSAHAICGSILTSRGCRCFCR
jgi:hypothetical protein